MDDFKSIGDILGKETRLGESGQLEMSDGLRDPPRREILDDDRSLTWGIPDDALLRWNDIPRRYVGPSGPLRFTTRLRGGIWDEVYHEALDEALVNGKFDPDYGAKFFSIVDASERDFFYDIHLNHASDLLSVPNSWFYSEKLLETRLPELLMFPFQTERSIVEFQEAVNEIRRNSAWRSSPWMDAFEETVSEYFDQVNIARKHDRARPFLMQERDIFRTLDGLLENYPDPRSVLLQELRSIIASAFDNRTPMGRYREMIDTGNFSFVFDTEHSAYHMHPSSVRVDMQRASFGTSGTDLVRKSTARLEGMGVLVDALSLIGMATQVAHAVEYWGLAEARFSHSLDIRGAVHPSFYRLASGQPREQLHSGTQKRTLEHTPNDFVFGSRGRIGLYTGLTEGGKTTAVRTISSVIALAQSIGFVPAEDYVAPVFSQFASLFGRDDRFEDGVSSFKSQVLAVNQVYGNRRPKVWLAADEFFQTNESGTGTQVLPNMLRAMAENGFYGALASHHHEGVEILSADPRFVCSHITDDLFYRLQDGVTPGGYAVRAALRAELHPDLLGSNVDMEIVTPRRPTERKYPIDPGFYQVDRRQLRGWR